MRNTHRAFSGQFSLLPSANSVLILRWDAGTSWIQLEVDFSNAAWRVTADDQAA